MKKENNKQKLQLETQTSDSGRSMVEMLGTLAVVGVLSITGIMGYTYAMKKYHANQIANELNGLNNQLAMIMTQPHDFDFELSLGEPYDNGYLTTANYSFDFGCGETPEVDSTCSEDNPIYFMELSNVPKDMCQTLAPMTQYLSNLDTLKIKSADNVIEENCSEDNSLLLLFNANDETDVNNEKEKKESNATDMYSTTSTIVSMSPITTFTSVSSKCQIDANRECCLNDDCRNHGNGYYCHTLAKCNSGQEIILESKCIKAEKAIAKTSTIYSMSTSNMSWFNAERFCVALNQSMVTYDNLNCADFIDASHYNGICHKTSTGSSEDSMGTNVADIGIEVYNAYGWHFAWIFRHDNNDEQSCLAKTYNYSGGHLTTSYKEDASSGYALCK